MGLTRFLLSLHISWSECMYLMHPPVIDPALPLRDGFLLMDVFLYGTLLFNALVISDAPAYSQNHMY
jgi:hypothetical protein